MNRPIPFSHDEWYHCYSRGVDKRRIFMNKRDYERFQMLLYTCNSKKPIHISNIGQSRQGPTLPNILEMERGKNLVDIGAYCLMPNHYHLLLKETSDGGITSFMRKLGTGYTMYFNIRHERDGALFSGRFKAKHVAEDNYFNRVVSYIHANPAELKEPKWKRGVIRNERAVQNFLESYPFSSLPDYLNEDRELRKIVARDALLEVAEQCPSVESILSDARIFARENDDFN